MKIVLFPWWVNTLSGFIAIGFIFIPWRFPSESEHILFMIVGVLVGIANIWIGQREYDNRL